MNDRDIDLFNSAFFKDHGMHDASMNYIHGMLQSNSALNHPKKLNEYYFQNLLETIVSRKTLELSKSFKVDFNVTFDGFKTELEKHSKSRLNPLFDLHIKSKKNNLLAAYEVKSIFGIDTSSPDVLKDITRLALTNKLFSTTKCVLIIVGKKTELTEFFNNSKFPFANNIQSKKRTYSEWEEIEVSRLGILDREYKIALKELFIKQIQIRLSRTQTSENYHCMSYIIRIPPGFRHPDDFMQVTWDEIREGDFVFEGLNPPSNIGSCFKIDLLNQQSSQIMIQTNSVDDQEWTEVEWDSLVWKYVPQGGRI